jgi:hypothetical protein
MDAKDDSGPSRPCLKKPIDRVNMKELLGRLPLFCVSLLLSSIALADASGAVGGVFMVVKGDIKISSKSGKTEPAKIGTKVTEGDTVQSGHDSRAKIVMTDKNVLNISPDSKLTIEKYQNNGDAKNVELKVEFGKVRASVEQKYDGDKSKFNIRTPTAVAGVRGTDFMMGYNSQTRISEIVTFSGMVAVGQLGIGGTVSKPVYVPPGHSTLVGDGKPPESPKAVPASDLKQMNQDSKTDAKNGGPSATVTSTASSNKPSMIDSKDVDPVIVTEAPRGPAGAPSAVSPPPTMPPPPPPPPPQVNEYLKKNTHLNIIITH